MKLSRKNASFLRRSLKHWEDSGLMNAEESKKLSDDIEVSRFDWRRLAEYSMWISIVCIVIAVGSVFADQALMELIEKIFHAPDIVKSIVLFLIAAVFYAWGIKRSDRFPEKIYTNESILFIGVLCTAMAVYKLGKVIDNGSGHFSILLLLSAFIYGVIGFVFKSGLIWVFAMISLGSWFGAETGYVSDWGAYYLGMNYPLRFIFFGGIAAGLTFLLKKKQWFEDLFRPTLIMGLLYLFIALWILSIFGNYGEMEKWQQVSQIELLPWALLFSAVCIGSIYHGLRTDNSVTKGFGITFLFIDLYTRYFEYFWNGLHKALFFSILGITFWIVGSRAERIWHLGGFHSIEDEN